MSNKLEMENKQSCYARALQNYSNELYKSINIKVDSGNIIELQYFILLLQSIFKIEKRFNFDLLIEPSSISVEEQAQKENDKIRAQISDYLACFRHSLFNRPVFKVSEGAFKNKWLQVKESAYGRIIPFIPINYEIYEFLSDRVGDVFIPSLVVDKTRFDLSHRVEERILKDKNGREKVTKKFIISIKGEKEPTNAKNILYNACISYLFASDGRSQSNDFFSFLQDRITEYTSSEFFEKIKDISVLAFLIFSAHNRFNLLEGLDNITKSAKIATYNSDVLVHLLPNEKEDDDILISSMDMADGLLQLIENVVFHAGNDDKHSGMGILSFRIFKKEQSTFDEYLKPRYTNYFDGHDNRFRFHYLNDEPKLVNSLVQFKKYSSKPVEKLSKTDLESHLKNLSEIEARKEKRTKVPFYLEVKLIDNSGKNMCNVFARNHIDDEYFKFKNVFVSTLFNPTLQEQESWQYFNSNPNNVVHHYGLQLFDALVQSIDGCFVAQSIADNEIASKKNFYSTSGDMLPQKDQTEYFSGTQYSILLPFNKRVRKDYSFVNTNVEYPLPLTKYNIIDKSNRHMIEFIQLLVFYGKKPYRTQKEKDEFITKLSRKLPKPIEGEDLFDILLFESKYLNTHNFEIFAKSLMQYIAINQNKKLNIAITDCSDDILKQLIRVFAVFYDRSGNNKFMSQTQIYLSGKDSKNEFLLAGINLKDSLVAQIKLDVARGITREAQTGTLAFLLDMLERRPGENTGKGSVEYVPFDLLIKCNVSVRDQGFHAGAGKEMNLSVFERNVLDVITSDVQDINPGCRIAPNHMRIGSKIHVNSFYEALVLFSNNYYTGRFAWLLMTVINNKLNLRPTLDKPFLFIGYETYSEILLRDLCKLYGTDLAKYCVFEYGTRDMSGKKSSNIFRNIEDLGDRYYEQVFIVPINSTLSTFNKLEAEYHRVRKSRANQSATYLGVIQTLHPLDDESTPEEKRLMKKFFGKIDPIERTIESKLINIVSKSYPISLPVVHYLFCVPAKWSDPILCKRCYPENYLDEEPLVETDKTSVIPAQLYGLKSRSHKNSEPDESRNFGSIEDLRGCVCYGHTYRGANHFQYYIETDKFFRKVSSQACRAPILPWLSDVRNKLIETNDYYLHYDIIVCPEHYSNAGFVTLVNDEVFKGASLIIGINFGKEFRDNFKAKHSDLTSIYNNLKSQNCRAEISFHFVDDTIIHGSSFIRVKSLVRSLFPNEAFCDKQIKINIFKSVIVLINRNSTGSIMNYVSRREQFNSFLNINISSMRTHDNACILCQETSINDMLRKRSALNDLSKRFSEKEKLTMEDDVFSKSISRIGDDAELRKKQENEKRGFLRLRCTHKLNNAFTKMNSEGKSKNVKIDILIALIEELIEGLQDYEFENIDILISYITVASSPFISFRKSVLEAVFDLVLLLFEIVLSAEINIDDIILNHFCKKDNCDFVDEKKVDKLTKLLNVFISKVKIIIENPQNHRDLTKALIKQSVTIKSNYIIRAGNIIRILLLSSYMDFNCADKFDNYYLFYVKKLLSSSTDEAKAMFLEYLLLTGKEYNGIETVNSNTIYNLVSDYKNHEHKIPAGFIPALSNLLRNLYLENTQIIFDAAHDIKKNDDEEHPVETTNIYYLENYKKMLRWNNANQELISQALKNLVTVLYKEPKAHFGGVLGYFTELAKSLAILLASSISPDNNVNEDGIIICFLGERAEPVLLLDEKNGNVVRRDNQKVLDCFAISNESLALAHREDNSYEVSRIIETSQQMVNDNVFVLSTYSQKEGKYYLFNLGGNFREENYPFEGLAKIRIAVYFKESCSDYHKLKAIRYLLAFNNQISSKIDECLKGDLLSEELRSLATKKQMQKARAGDHFDDDIIDDYSPKLFAESVFLSDNRREGFTYSDKEAVYGYYINSTMGRINIKLLAESRNKWNENFADNDTDEQLIDRLCSSLASIKNITRKELIRFCGIDNYGKPFVLDPKDLKEYFKCKFRGHALLRNKMGFVPRFDYIVAITAELVNSVEKHGIESEADIYDVTMYVDSNGYFCIANKVSPDFSMQSIKDGLLRKNHGISLATTCGFFDYFYSPGDQEAHLAPRVKIYEQNNSLYICLPIFKS